MRGRPDATGDCRMQPDDGLHGVKRGNALQRGLHCNGINLFFSAAYKLCTHIKGVYRLVVLRMSSNRLGTKPDHQGVQLDLGILCFLKGFQ